MTGKRPTLKFSMRWRFVRPTRYSVVVRLVKRKVRKCYDSWIHFLFHFRCINKAQTFIIHLDETRLGYSFPLFESRLQLVLFFSPLLTDRKTRAKERASESEREKERRGEWKWKKAQNSGQDRTKKLTLCLDRLLTIYIADTAVNALLFHFGPYRGYNIGPPHFYNDFLKRTLTRYDARIKALKKNSVYGTLERRARATNYTNVYLSFKIHRSPIGRTGNTDFQLSAWKVTKRVAWGKGKRIRGL